MEAPLPQPSQPGVTSPPLRPKPIPPPRNPSFRRGSQDGRFRTDGMRSPTSGSNPNSPLSSPQRVPGGNGTSPQRKPDVVRSHAMPPQPVESRGSGSSTTISPVRTLLETQQKGTIEFLAGPERRGADGTSQTNPEVEDRKPDSSPQTFSPVNNLQEAPHVPDPQQKPETKAGGTSLQWTPADRQPWRNEMSTSFSSSPPPAPLDIGANHVQSPQQILERTRQSPASPRWIQPGSRGTDDNRIQHPIRMGQGASMSPAKTPQMESNENAALAGMRNEAASSNGIRETCLVSTLHPHGVPDTVTDSVSPCPPSTSLVPDTTSPQHVTGTRLVADIAKPPESQLVSPKRVYSYSVILTGTSNIQSNQQGIGLSTGSGSPSHMKSETPKSPTWSTASGTSSLVNSLEPPPSMGTSDVPSTIEFQPSADSATAIRPAVNPTSPKRNLTSKPPLPFPAGQRLGSTEGHPVSPSSAPSSLQYIAPKSSLYSVLNPVPERTHTADIVSLGIASTEPGLQRTPVSGPALVPESSLASSPRKDAGSLSSLDPGLPTYRSQTPAPDSMSYLDSVSMMSGTVESLSLMDDASSMGSDSEVNGMSYRRTDKYGFLGGNQFSAGTESSLSVDVARQREIKWLDMFKHWDKWVSRRFQKVKLRCRKGIPSSLRARAWQHLSNSKELIDRNPGKFDELERDPGDPKWLDVIEKDLHRQFPFHEMFVAREGHGQKDLYRILKAYTIYRPDEGYCQAQAPVAAVLLMHMPAEQAFWCLVQICEKYLPGYYSAGLEAIQLDGEIFFALLRRASPMAYRHLKKYKIDPILYMTEWFMCIFSRTLPWSSVLRVWDMFFCEGVKIIFRVGLVILRHTLGSVDKLRSCQGMYETMEKLRSLPAEYLQEAFLVQEVCALPVTEALIERENSTQLKKWRENRGELQYKPSRRLHGTRAVFEEHHRMNPLTASSSLLSLTSLRRASKEERWRDKGHKEAPGFSPAHSIGNLALSSGPSAAPSAATMDQSTNNVAKPKGQKTKGKAEKPDAEVKKPTLGAMPPGQVVSEGLHPALPSPTGNVMPLGEPKKAKDRKKEKDLEKQRAKEQKEKERQDRERERLEKEREKEMEKQRAKEQKEKERLEKEKERKLQKERVKEESRHKKERKLSIRKKEVPPGAQEKGAGNTPNQPEKVAGVRGSVSEPATQVSTEEQAIPTGSTGVAVVQDSYS